MDPRRRLQRSSVTLVFLLSTMALSQVATSTGAAASGGGQYPPAPTLAQQLAGFSPSQMAFYSSKVQALHSLAQARAGSRTIARPNVCIPGGCVPASHYSWHAIVWEGSNDCACGPATAVEMYSSFTHYYGQPSSTPTLSAMESEMQYYGWYTCANGTWRTGLMREMNLHQSPNPYVLEPIYSGTDVWNDTAIDVGLYNFPVGYDGQTDGPYGYVLPNYYGVNWGHYFPAYGYDQYSNVYVADPHFAYNYGYSATAIYEFIANFTLLSPQLVW